MKYAIDNPDRGKWDVYEKKTYDAAHEGINGPTDEDMKLLYDRLSGYRLARFKTRRAAREYVESIGGTY